LNNWKEFFKAGEMHKKEVVEDDVVLVDIFSPPREDLR